MDRPKNWPTGAVGDTFFDSEEEALAWKAVVDAASARGEWPPALTEEALRAAVAGYRRRKGRR